MNAMHAMTRAFRWHAAAVLAACLLLAMARSTAGAVELVSSPELPQLRLGETREQDLQVRNGGHSRIVISSIVPECGCIRVSSFTRAIEAGAIGDVRIAYDARSRAGHSTTKLAVAYTCVDGPVEVVALSLGIKTIDEPRLRGDVKKFYFGTKSVLRIDPFELTGSNDGRRAYRVVRIESDDNFTARLVSPADGVVRPGGKICVRVAPRPVANAGYYDFPVALIWV